MVRKTALVTAMLGAFASHAYALGLGEITLNSALHQPLDAEVALRSATPEEIDELNVSLASPTAYERAGVERIYLHTKLRFNVETRPDGSAVIKVTSQDPIREPYLDFLLEASWGSGQVVREYTMLIDPPVLMPAEAAPAPTAPAVSQTAPRQVPAPTAPVRDRQVATFTGSEYGPVQRNDTLWTIAEQVRPDTGVSMQQTMLGLVRANPEAFQHGNVNNLKAGYVLRVPSRDELTSVSQARAQQEVSRHHRLWREGRTDQTTGVAAAGTVDRDAAGAEQPAATAADAAPAPGEDAQLKLVTPEEAAATSAAATGEGGTGEVEQVRKDLALAVEELEAQRQQNQDLNERLADLEQQISQLHRLVQLSDTELAQMQDSAAQPDPVTPAATDSASEAEAADRATQDTAPADEQTTQTPAAETPGEAGMDVAATTEQAEAESAPALQEEVVMVEEIRQPTPAAAGGDLVSRFLTNPLMQLGAGAVALLLLALAWLAARKRRMGSTEFKESILAEPKGAAPAAPSATTVEAAAVASAAATAGESEAREVEQESQTAAAGPQSDSSLFTDFSVSDMGAIQNEAEADPVAEADVYLAYGRYQQAEELVKAAVDKEPERNDLRLKLLEIYFAAKNQSAFDAEAEALLAQLESQDDPMWQRVVEMGRELSPQSRLYQDGATAAAAPAARETPEPAEPAADETLEGMGFDTEPDSTADSEPAAEGDTLAEAGLEAETFGAAEAEEDNTLDFNLDDLDTLTSESDAVGAEEKADVPMLEDDDNLLEFDLAGSGEAHQEAESEDVDIEDGELQAGDEISTKLDLARAYIEMGDPEGARSILEEVMDEGSDAQKNEAQDLLRDVG